MRRSLLRLAAAAAAVVVATLLFEGAHSILLGRPLLGSRGFLLPGIGRLHLTDEERAAAAVQGGGPFALACDPEVAFTLKADATHVLGAPARVDDHGMRVRIGAEPGPGARRIVLLGDSVTFGFGVRDDETMAHRLERHLAAVTPPGAAAPVVFTVACPGWNVWNCGRALRDHVGRLQPDIVVYTPIANDLYDSFATTESGHRSFDFDPAVGGTRPHVSFESHVSLLAAQAPLLSAADALSLRLAGGWDAIPPVAFSGVTPESRRRWRGFVDVVADLDARMRAREGRFLVQLCFDDTFELLVDSVLGEHLPDVPIVPPFRDRSTADQLGEDPHPNAACVDARARVLAATLLDLGWVAGSSAALPAPAEAYAKRVAERRAPGERSAWRREREALWRAHIGAAVDLTRARGAHQVYGGVEPDGTVGRGAWLVLAPAVVAAQPPVELELELERLPHASGVYPLELRLRWGDRRERALAVPPPTGTGSEVVVLRAPVPEASDRSADEQAWECIDLRLEPDNWVLERHEGRSRLAALRLRRAELVPAGK